MKNFPNNYFLMFPKNQGIQLLEMKAINWDKSWNLISFIERHKSYEKYYFCLLYILLDEGTRKKRALQWLRLADTFSGVVLLEQKLVCIKEEIRNLPHFRRDKKLFVLYGFPVIIFRNISSFELWARLNQIYDFIWGLMMRKSDFGIAPWILQKLFSSFLH